MSRVWPKWWDTASEVRFEETVAPISSLRFALREASCQGVKKPMRQGTDDLGQQPAKNSVSEWAWKPVLLLSSLEMTEAPAMPWQQPCERAWARDTQLNRAGILDPQKLSAKKCVLFLATQFWGKLLHSDRFLINHYRITYSSTSTNTADWILERPSHYNTRKFKLK